MIRKQATNRILMVRPALFGYNPETAINNAFQKALGTPDSVAKQAQKEFDAYVALLRDNGVDVWVVQDSPKPHTPDSIFPNNWFSTHVTGELILYPMYAQNRQLERKLPILATVGEMDGVKRIIDLKSYESQRKFLEGTGSMVLDRVNKIAYCCASERSSFEVLEIFREELDYSMVFFHAVDAAGADIYHTNVMMCVASRYAVVCLDAVRDTAERETLILSLTSTGHEVIDITPEQINHFAGNMLELESDEGQSLIIMSAEAKRSLTPEQIDRLEQYSKIIAPELNVIETNGGGSARCMIAEIFFDNN